MAWVERRGRRWLGRYRDAGGKVHYAGSSTSKREAKRLADEKESELRRGVWHDPTLGRITFSEYFEQHWLPTRLREKTTIEGYLAHYNAALRDTFGHVEIRHINAMLVQRWVAELVLAGKRPSTVRAYFRTLKTVLAGRSGSSAIRDGLIRDDPCDGADLPYAPPSEPDVYTVEEVDQLMAEIPERWRLLPILAADSGMRWGELLGLRVGDFAGSFSVVTVCRTIQEVNKEATGNGTRFAWKNYPKERGGRKVIVLSNEVARLVEAHVQAEELSQLDRLFSMPARSGSGLQRTDVWPEGLPVGRSYFREQVWKPAHERAGVRPRVFHDLRGSHMVWLLSAGVDLATVMRRVGHRQLKTTQGYLAALPDADRRAAEALENFRSRYRPDPLTSASSGVAGVPSQPFNSRRDSDAIENDQE